MESLLGRSIFNGAVAFSSLASSTENQKAEVWHAKGKVKATGIHQQQQQPRDPPPSSSNSSTLPLPQSRSSFPGPLKFLWFTKQGDVEERDAVDPFSVADNHLQPSSSSADEIVTDTDLGKSSWGGFNIWGMRPPNIRIGKTEDCQSKKLPDELNDDGGNTQSNAAPSEVCLACEMDGTEECFTDSVTEPSAIEVPHIQTAHDRQSFSKFLQPVSLAESRLIARMVHLCNLAYKIQDIKPSDLHHHLKLITSSLDKKLEALAKEKDSSTTKEESDGESDLKQQQQQQQQQQIITVTPASAYGLASSVASYLHSHAKALLRLKQRNEALQKRMEEDSIAGGGADSLVPEADYEASEMASFIASSPMTAVVGAKDGTKDAVAKDLQSLHNCPCEWYCCDDKQSSTRYFIIQGSESLASWQANLLFEPTHFEDSSLGVMVHRGIYEAAKGLYQQLLPCVLEHLSAHGDQARFRFTGHSLGGSLATLVSLMLQIRGVVRREALLPVFTFGSPCIMCGGDYLLEKLELPRDHIRSVILHRDIVPRTFACNYPDHVAELLKRLNGSFRDHPCLNNQRLLYAPMGQFLILQPSEDDAPAHPLLPSGAGMYTMKHPQEENDVSSSSQRVEVRAAQRAFLNSPHPLEILSDRGAYGSEGSISRDHDPRSYMKSITKVVKEEAKKSRKLKRQQRRGMWWPLMTAELTSMFAEPQQFVVEEEPNRASAAAAAEMLLFRGWRPKSPSGRKNLYSDLMGGVPHSQVQQHTCFGAESEAEATETEEN